jgi:tetratricopeptide (TPR) repeat protein
MAIVNRSVPAKPARNEACSCGSGRKYKKCCGAHTRALDAAALHQMGVIEIQEGRPESAAKRIRQAIALDPAAALFQNNLGCALQQLGLREDAAAAYLEALRLDPDYVDSLSNLGGVLFHLGAPRGALPYLEKAVGIDARNRAARCHLVMVLAALDRNQEALAHAREVIGQAPPAIAGIQECIQVLTACGRWSEAVPYLERWIALDPRNAKPYQWTADCHAKQGLWQDAAIRYGQAFELEPTASAANNLGACLAKEGRWADALVYYRHAVDLDPHSAEGWTNMGNVVKHMGNLETALRCFDGALALDPTHVHAHWNRSLCLLSMGALQEGWAEYEWGWKTGARHPVRPFALPLWEGSDPAGKTILVSMEQGLGDHILFSSLLPDLLNAGAHLIVECEPRLVSLMGHSFRGAEVVAMADPPHPRTQQPDIDFQVPAGNLPRWLRPGLESFPQRRGYLIPDAERIALWKQRIEALGGGLKIGICWRSQNHQGVLAPYFAQLNQWGPILTIPGIHFVNLQYDRCDADLDEAERRFGARIHRWDDMDLRNDQEGVAALISTLDLVVSATTAVHEMAGAVGAPVWVLARGSLNFWGLGTDSCPWLPTVRAFPCGPFDPWEPVIERVASELRALAGN